MVSCGNVFSCGADSSDSGSVVLSVAIVDSLVAAVIGSVERGVVV